MGAAQIRLSNGAVLAIGSRPPPGRELSRNFDVLVLCATDYQPPKVAFPGVQVIHVPMDDNPRQMTSADRLAARNASWVVARHLKAGKRVLVTCWAGLNRSALVATLALVRLGVARPAAVAQARSMRPGALFNPHFVRMIERQPLRAA